MIQHTLILAVPKMNVPSIGIVLLVNHLIDNFKTKIEYFGLEPDNQADFVDEEMEYKIANTTFIEIHFESEMPIDYDQYEVNQIHTLILDKLKYSKNKETSTDGKDITIYLN